MPGRGDNSLEFQVSLGLQGAQQQIDLLHKALEESVKIDSNGFKGINKMLESAQSQAEKLSSKMGEAFKTSAGSRNFLKDYQKMLETLSQIRSKMGNLGFDDIKFSVQDQNEINDTVKKMQDLEKVMQSIQSGKAINVINNSSVENVDILKKKISDLSIDTSKLTFDNLRVRLSDAAEEASNKLEKTKERINSIDSIIKRLDISGLQEIQNKINISTGLSTKLIDDKSIDEANRKLRELTEQFSGLSDKAKSNLQVNQKTGDIGNFIQKQTENIKSEYQKQIEVVRTSKEAINKAMQSINAVGHEGKNGRTYYSTQKLTELVNSEAMKTQIEALGINLTELFKDKTIAQQVSALKEALTKGLESLTIKENDLTNLRNSFEQALQNVFTGLTTSSVTNVKAFKDNITETLSNFDIKAIDLKNFGFDINSISAGESLASVYDRLRSAIDQYTASLSTEKANLSSTELVQRTQALKDLEAAQKAADAAQGQSDEVLKTLQGQIAECAQKIEELVQKYNQLTGQKIDLNLGDIPKQTDQAVTGINRYIESITKLEGKQKALSNVQSAVTRWMGFYQVLNLTKRAINDMKQHVQELDAVMTKIAVVTNMTQNDLWNQIGTYSEIARQYGVAIKGVYEVSQIYYQQGLNKGDVMGLTTETLKMARIAGIDYATAADYMTTAVRGFKLEMSDAAHVTDVFSNLAAHTASSTEELAVAISKTAASAASVGSSFEATSAMMATMIATTRESATNIGTALKSIIARYGELKENMTGTDAEGEEYSLNKVDKALQSVGISIHDTAGQFRDFDDVILELAEAWDTIDKNTQRYIATVMAGNRQQSRFLALVSNVEEYKRALELANNSDNAGELQVLKTLDSVDAKIERMKVTIQEFYTSSGIQDLYKNILDTITNVISAANNLPKMFGNLPVTAIAVGLQIIAAIKNILTLVILQAQSALERIKLSGKNAFSSMASDAGKAGQTAGKNFRTNFEAQMAMLQGSGKSLLSKFFSTDAGKYIGHIASTLLSTGGAALSLSATNAYGASRSGPQDQNAARSMFGSAALNGLSGFISGTLMGGPWVGAINGIASLLPSLISGLSMNQVTLAREIELQTKVANESKQQATLKSGEAKELEAARDKLEKLKNASIESAEAMQEYKDYMNQLADTYPELVSRLELTGDKTIELADLESKLASARIEASKATIQSLKDEADLKNKQKASYEKLASNRGLPKELNSNNTDFSFLENYIWTYGSDYQRSLLGQGDKYSALLDLYNSFNREKLARENLDSWHDNFNEKQVTSNLSKFNNLQQIILSNPKSKGMLQSALKNNLSDFLKETQGNVTLSEITDGAITELSDLDNKELTTQSLINIIHSVTKNAQDYIDLLDNSINDINDTLDAAELQLEVDKKIGTKKINGKQLSNYSSFITQMMQYQFGKDYDWTSEEGQQQFEMTIDSWFSWLNNNTDNADWLMQNLNFADIRDAKGLTDLLSSHGIKQENVGQKFLDNIINEFNKTRENVQDAYQESLKAAFDVERWSQLYDLGHYDLYALFNNNISEHDNLELDQQLAENLQKNLYEYKKLIDNDQQILAENYLIGLENSFKIIGSYNNEQQDTIQSIIESIDWSDSTSLSSAAEALRNIGPEYEELAHELDLASERFATNITTRVMQLRDSAADTIKSIEKVMDNAGKVTKSSDALENVNTMLNSYTGEDRDTLNFTSIYEWNKELNGYVLTEKGIQVWLDSINEKNIEELKKAENQLKELKSLYGEQNQQGTMYSAEKGLSRDTVLESFKAAYTDEQGKLTIDEDTLNARTDAFMAEYEDLRAEFSKQTDLSWEQFIDKKKEALILTNEKEIENLKNMPYQEIVSQIASIDYKSIAGGTATQGTRETLKTLLEQAGISKNKLDAEFEDIWNDMLAGNFDRYNQLLADASIDIKVSDTDAFAALQEEYKQYSEGLSEILSSEPIAAWSEATKEIAGITNETDLTTVDTGAIALRFLQRIAQLVELGAATIEDQEQSIINVMNQNDKEAGIGRQKQLLDSLKNGFTNEELVKLGGVDDSGNLKEELINLVEKDNNTGDFKIIAKGSAVEILDQFAEALGITLDKNSDAYKEAVSSGIDEAITERAKNNTGKQIANQIQTLSSAKVGDEVNISLLSSSMKQALGLSENAEILTIESEERRDALLLLLETSISEYEDAGKEALIATYNNIKNSITSKKGSQNNLVSGIVSSTVSKDTWKSYVANVVYPEIDINYFNEKNLQTIAFNRGYIWDEYTQQYRATTRALETINKDIENAIESNAAPETIAELRRQAGELERTLTHDNKRDALTNLITNYQDAESYLSDFYGQFGYSKDFLKERGILTEVNGKSIVDINKLNELIDGYDDVFKTITDQIADEYISNAQKAGTLFTQGTTSQVEMSGFQEAYKKLTGAEVEFIFDPLLQAWTIDVTNLKTYLSKVAEKAGLDNSWVESQIKTLVIDNLDFSGYLAGTNTAKDNKVLRKNLTNYFKSQSERYDFSESLEDWAKSQVDDTLEILSFGGQRAINRLKSIKGELTQNEIEAAYRAQIAPIQSVVERLNELRAGNIVAKNQIDALNTAGFKVNTDGVIISTGNLVAAYKSLYDQMKATNEATIAELNTALGKYLDSRDGEQAVIDALSNAASMTYSQLAEIYTQAGIELTESMINELEASGIIKGLGGNKMMIQDFESFAASMGWNADSEEYVKAFKAYNDSLIQLDNATEKAIVEEVNAVLKANPGDKVNLTYLANQLHLAAGEIWELEGATLKDGILSIEKGANIGNITNQLIALARSSTENIEEELEELAYAVQQLLADIANTIKNGISGSLKRDEAKKVTDWASQYGVKVDFNETAEGLQITNNSARDLYNTINAIDRLQGQVVFEALKDNLIKTDERFQSASANAAYIAKLERDIEITKKNNNDKFDDTKINQYKKELELAQKINETRGLTEDSSFKFMEQDIPSGQKNPLNYWSNWGKAFTVMNESRTNGTMAYEDFRNIITEMGNLVDITDQAITLGGQTLNNSKEAASLIEAAAGALEVQTDGSLKVNLKKIGVEFQTGSESMTNGIDKGIQEIANSQIEMLDSLIGLLEVIVQMEQLSDLDLDSDMQLDLSEIFNDDITDFNGSWISALGKWRDMMTEGTDTFNEDFKRGMESIKFTINGELVSLAQVIGADFDQLDDLHISPQLYQAIMNGLYESVRSGDFSEENVKELIMQNLQKHLSELTDEPIVFDMGNYTFIGSGNASFDIDWTADNTKKALEWIDDSIENKKQYLIDAFAARGRGEANTTQLQATLITDGVLTIKNNKPTVILKDYNGHSQAFTSDDAQYAEALQAKMLEQVGAKEIKLGTIGTSAAVGELNVGQATLTVRSFKGQIQYLSEETNQWYPTLSDLIAAEAGDNEEAKEQLEIKYGLKVVPLIEVDENQYRQATEKQIQEIQAAIQSRDLGEVQKLAAQIGVKINKDETTATAAEWKEIEKQFDIETKTVTLKGDTEDAETKVDNVQEKLDKLIENKDQTISIEMHKTNYGTTVSALNTINDQLRDIAKNRNQQINITTVKTTVENESKKPGNKKSPPKNNAQYTKESEATGNVALSKGTLMGELGPELVVSKGRYYIVGQNGPEFVDLEEDAIVFNHLQTKSLLQRGVTFGRGAPVTNERNAVAFAGGNITGPAMASASSILSILKELRAMWKSLLQSSTKDLASLGGSGGGGGGGKNSNADNAAKAGEFTKELEKWYNWLQKISILGKKLNYEEKLRSKIASDMYSHGQDYTASQLKSLDYLQSQIAVEKSLVASQKEYFEKRRKELNESPMGALYTFDEYGQLKYNNGTFGAFARLLETDKNNKPTFSAKDQYEILVEAGYGDYMKYNQSGEEITKETETNSSGETVEKADQSAYYKNAVQAFWDKVDSDKNEMQSLRDSIEQYEAEILEKMTEANEIMKEIEDNQISVEEKVLKAIEDIREREIEELQSTRDAMEEAANELISGLSDQLSKEKDMYAQQESQDELTKLQRQLAILQRSGGSASQIAGLQKEITLKQRDAYFEAQQRQIDALQAASNAELERLDNQIELMNETLAYQKLHGLLWEEVYQVLQGTPEEITDYIIQNTREYWGESPTKLTQDTRGILTEVQRFTAFRDTVKNGMDELINKFSDKTLEQMAYEETRRMNTEIEEGNAELSAGAQRIVDAINAKEISLNQVINNYETPAAPASGGDTGSGTGTGATSGPAEQKTDTNSNPQKSWIIAQAEKVIDAANSIDHWIAEGETEQGTTIKIGSTYKTQAAAQAAIDRAKLQGLIISGYATPIPGAKTGAIVDKSGIAEIHDNEVILTAEQTKFLRNDILSNKPTSLLSLLTDFRDAYNSIPNASAYSTVNNGGVTIENATVEMNVSKISNDYDAQRAGEQALEKMMQIARKTSAQNRIGR